MVTSNTKKVQISGRQKPQLERNDTLQLYYNDIRQYELLSKEETKELFKLYHNGTKEERDFAFDKIFKHNMRFVVSLARDYCSNEDNLNDLIQEGNFGLMKAIEMFDEENGAPFAGYSAYWIRRYINVFRTNVTPIVVKTNRSKTINVISTITNELYQKFERIPTPEEILDEYNLKYPNKPIKNTDDIVNVEYVFIDQLEPINDANQDSQAYIDYNTASLSRNSYLDDIDSEHRKKILSQLLDGLTEKETKVIRMLYGLDDGIETNISFISSEMGVSNQRVNQLYTKALKKMKNKSQKLSYSFK